MYTGYIYVNCWWLLLAEAPLTLSVDAIEWLHFRNAEAVYLTTELFPNYFHNLYT